MIVLEDRKQEMSLRNISRISGISLSGYYYRPVERHIQRLDPSTRERIREIASERPTYGYRRVWAILRNQGTKLNQKTVRKVLKDSNLSLPASRHRGRTKTRTANFVISGVGNSLESARCTSEGLRGEVLF